MKKAELDIAEQNLKETKVYLPVPIDVPEELRYTITDRYVAQGAWLAAGTDLFRLVIDETLKLRLTIPERYAGDVKIGQKVHVSTIANAEPVEGVVARIGPAVDPTTRTFQLEAEVPNKQGVLKTGGFAKARVSIAATTAQTVPVSALVTFAGVHKIFIVDGEQVKEVQVTLGQQSSEWVEIAQPALPSDAIVVTSGQTKLADGSPIRIRKPEDDWPLNRPRPVRPRPVRLNQPCILPHLPTVALPKRPLGKEPASEHFGYLHSPPCLYLGDDGHPDCLGDCGLL